MQSRREFLVLGSVLIVTLCGTCLLAEDQKPATPSDQTQAGKPRSCTPQEKDPKRHEGFLKDKERLQEKGPIELVFIGDSITDGWRGGGKQIFHANYDRYNTLNLGIGGDRTEHILWRIDHNELDGLHPRAVVLMIGTNNLGTQQSVEDAIAGVKCDVKAIHEKLPEAKILLLAVFPRGHEPTDHFRDEIKQVNEAISELDGKENVTYLDINDKFLEKDGTLEKNIMPDYLHPNEKGYMIWAEAMKPKLEELMK